MSAAVACCFKTLLRLFEILIDTWQWERFSPRYVPLGLAEKVTALSYSTIKSYVHWQLFQLEINRVNIIPSGGKHIVWCHKVLTDNISIKGWMGTIKQCLIKWPLFVCVCVCVLKGAFKTTAPFRCSVPRREHASALIIVLYFDHSDEPDRHESHEKLPSHYRVFESQFEKGPGCLWPTIRSLDPKSPAAVK